MKLSKKALLEIGCTDFDGWQAFARRPYGEVRDYGWFARPNKKAEFFCEDGPWAGQTLWLTIPEFYDDYEKAVGTLVFRVGEQVGRYVGQSRGAVVWEAA